jgi:hypothetical protein
MRECHVGADRASAALAPLRESGFDPAVPAPAPVLTVVPDAPATSLQRPQQRLAHDPDADADSVSEAPVDAISAPAQIDEEALVSDAAGAGGYAHPARLD